MSHKDATLVSFSEEYVLHFTPPPAAQGTINAACIRKVMSSNMYSDTYYPAISHCSLPDVCIPFFFLRVFLNGST